MESRHAITDRAVGASLRRPTVDDAPGMLSLVRACPPLDANSGYVYLLLAQHFNDTCRVADDASGICGMVTAYHPPGRPETIFVWQVAVAPRARGKGIGRRLVAEVTRGAQWIETTITPGNAPSEALFLSLAACRRAILERSPLFSRDLFLAGGDATHEEELLYRIGPCLEHP